MTRDDNDKHGLGLEWNARQLRERIGELEAKLVAADTEAERLRTVLGSAQGEIDKLLAKLAAAETALHRTDGVAMIAAEREKQRAKWSDAHDDQHVRRELAINAAAILTEQSGTWGLGERHDSRLDRLVIAGALVAAEIDRMLRLAALAEKDGAP